MRGGRQSGVGVPGEPGLENGGVGPLDGCAEVCGARLGGMSPIQAPIAASLPARYLSFVSARRGEVIWSIKRTSSRRSCTGAWCQAAM